MSTIHGSGITVQLPYQPGFLFVPQRQEATLIAIDGSLIQQRSALSVSSIKATYNGHMRESDAVRLKAMAETSASVVIAPGDGTVYAASITVPITPATDPSGSSMITVSFSCSVSEQIV